MNEREHPAIAAPEQSQTVPPGRCSESDNRAEGHEEGMRRAMRCLLCVMIFIPSPSPCEYSTERGSQEWRGSWVAGQMWLGVCICGWDVIQAGLNC